MSREIGSSHAPQFLPPTQLHDAAYGRTFRPSPYRFVIRPNGGTALTFVVFAGDARTAPHTRVLARLCQ